MASLALLSIIAVGYFWEVSYVSQTSITIGQSPGLDVSHDDVNTQSLADRLSSMFFSRTFQESLVEEFVDPGAHEDIDTQVFLDDFQKRARFSIENSSLARLSYASETPEHSQQRLAVILKALLSRIQPKSKAPELEKVGEEIEAERLRLDKRIQDITALINDIRLSNFDEDNSSSKQRIASIRESIQDVEVNINAAHAKIGGIFRKLEKEGEIREAQLQFVEMTAQREKLVASVEALKKEDSYSTADVISIEQEIDNLNVQIASFSEIHAENLLKSGEESETLFSNLRNRLTLEEVELASLLSREESLRSLLKDVRSTAASEESYTIEIEQHQRMLDELTQEASLLKTRGEQNLRAQKAAREIRPDYLVLDRPSLPHQYSGLGFVEFLIIGPIVAFFLPLILASLVVLLDSRIRTLRQLRMHKPDAIPILGVIPHYSSPKTSRVFHKAMLSLLLWGAFVFSVYFTLGFLGLKQ